MFRDRCVTGSFPDREESRQARYIRPHNPEPQMVPGTLYLRRTQSQVNLSRYKWLPYKKGVSPGKWIDSSVNTTEYTATQRLVRTKSWRSTDHNKATSYTYTGPSLKDGAESLDTAPAQTHSQQETIIYEEKSTGSKKKGKQEKASEGVLPSLSNSVIVDLQRKPSIADLRSLAEKSNQSRFNLEEMTNLAEETGSRAWVEMRRGSTALRTPRKSSQARKGVGRDDGQYCDSPNTEGTQPPTTNSSVMVLSDRKLSVDLGDLMAADESNFLDPSLMLTGGQHVRGFPSEAGEWNASEHSVVQKESMRYTLSQLASIQEETCDSR
jgi:hypothetical protein